jgi:hypothetical protein
LNIKSVALVSTVVGLLGGMSSAANGIAAPVSLGSRYVAQTPVRLLDTRNTGGATGEIVINVPDVAAVAVTVTAVNARTAGFLSVWGGSERPNVSLLNVTPGQTVANTAIVKPTNGHIRVATNSGAEVLVDLAGTFNDTTAPVKVGRLVALSPERVLDTRGTQKALRGQPLSVDVSGIAPGATAAAVTVTAVNPDAAGFVTAWGDGVKPEASMLNVDKAGQTRAAYVIVPVVNGHFQLESSMNADLLADVSGFFTGPTANAGVEGLFVPTSAERILDTRTDNNRVTAGGAVEIPYGSGGIAALAGNVTAVSATDTGFVTAYPAGLRIPNASLINLNAPRETAANGAVLALSDRGVAFTASAGAHVLFDVSGYFTGTPKTATLPKPVNVTPSALISTDDWNLTIPAAGISTPVGQSGDTVDELPSLLRPSLADGSRLNPPVVPSMPLPGGRGIVTIVGHRVSHGAEFLNLTHVRTGDKIILTAGGSRYVYQIYSAGLVLPESVQLVDPARDGEIQVFSCSCGSWNGGCVSFRFLVKARLISGPDNR